MKTIVRSVLAAIAILFTVTAKSQNSCPVINNGSFRIETDVNNPCLRTIVFTFYNPTSGNKRIRVIAQNGTTELLNTCVDASGQSGVTRTFTSATFTICNLANLKVSVTPYTGNDCGGSPCAPTSYSIGGAPLPVVFTYFSALRNNEVVVLKWETATEINNTGFAIERNMNGTWQQVGFVATKAINGNSESKLNYSYNDINYNKGMTQYRLKQIDIDGKSKYSDIKAIRGTEQDAKTVLYPNPSADGKVNMVFADAAARDIAVMDMTGRIVKQWSSFSSNSLQITGLSTGMFSIRIINRETGVQTSEKFMVTAK